MPGILPMKVIKVGSNAQTRIAQACDRCRSKKIRCDGLRPCTQCGNVGFECKTSDKLSRRAFPRGYTESLEERVRALESEVRELKDLLDEKDEKIDMLSKIYDRSPQRRASSVSSQTISKELRQSSHDDRLDHFKCYQPQCFLTRESRDSLFIGSSSAWAFINSFKHKVQELGRHCSTLDADAFYPPHPNPPNSGLAKPNEKRLWNLPPRLMSDQMITVYFQEWAPLFPILHRPAFLALYEDYVSTPEAVQDRRSLVQLQLVFAIAALSNEARFSHNAELAEPVWSSVLNDFAEEVSLPTLQCLLLAQIYYIQTGNATKLLHYKSLSFGMVQKLGLHLAQKRFALGALTMESRKKIFWTFYTLDCFSAVFLGLPKCLKDQDIFCEYPVDVDDEYITEKGFQPTLPGEFTRLSSALALFRISRILSRVIEQNYPGSAPAELSLSKMTALDEELDTWSNDLAQHLRLEFCNDKPSTHVISSRCPLLSMTYHYIRALIHRPAVTANLGDRGSTSMMALASSSKHLIQIVQLMEERRLSFTHCINKNELLLMSGFGVLFQALELDRRAKLMRDSHKSACIVVGFLCRRGAPGAETLKRLVCSLLLIDPTTLRNGLQNGENARNLMLPKALSSRAVLANAQAALKNGRRAPSTMSTDSTRQDSDQTLEKSPSNSSAETARSQPKAKTSKSHSPRTATASSDAGYFEAATNIKSSVTPSEHPPPNLDYFQFPGDPCSPKGRTKAGQSQAPQHNATVWQKLLNTLDETQIHNVEDFYHWSSADQLASPMSLATSHPTPGSSVSSARELPLPHGPDLSGASADLTWTPDIWASRTMPFVNAPPTIPQSVFSFSEESLLSGDGMEGEHDSMSRGTDSPEGMMDGGHGQGDVLISQSTPDGGHESDEAYDFELLRRELSL